MSDHRLRTLRREAIEASDWSPYVRHLEQQLGINSDEVEPPVLDARPITEGEGEQAKWYAMAKDVDSIDAFIAELSAYTHDYGTVCHAISAAAVAASWVMAKDQGITGFQAGAVMWGYIQNWKSMSGPMRLVDYKNMLYPQYDDEFQKTMTSSTWTWLQEQAQKELDRGTSNNNVIKHWQSIVGGAVPFGWKVSR